MISLEQTRNHFGPDFSDEELELIRNFCVLLAKKEIDFFLKSGTKDIPLLPQNTTSHADSSHREECH